MKTKPLPIIICMIAISLFSHGKLYPQGFQIREVSDNVFIVSNPDLGDQVVVQSEKGLLIFDSFWSEKTARIFKEEISKTLRRDDFSYVINMVDRIDMFGGNAAYQEAVIVGHENILTKYSKEKMVKAEITELIEMWRYKEELSRNRLKEIEKGSEKALEEQEWMNICKSRADELESGFALVFPQIFYNDRMTLYLGDITINLLWFGETGNYRGLTMAVIPEEKLAILTKSILYPMFHLAPYPHPDYRVLDVPRWIALLEEILEGENAVTNIILSDLDRVFSRELMHSHLEYIRKLWDSVKTAEDEGKNLQEIQDQLSLEKDFAFVKEMLAYKNTSDDWIRPQHELHIRLFFLQHKNLASEIIKDGGTESLQASLNKIRKLGSDIYFDEISINRIGYNWMNMGQISEAIEVFKLNVEAFPQSSNVYDSLGEAYMKNGDTKNAINNYKKSLELNPDNNNAEEMLKKLETK
ncbi:MAG: tetratricopeptide repeat protein [Bacteroidales bacterium]|nr:tetratricopeptide repeat protein [Bacteroidales bacterium]